MLVVVVSRVNDVTGWHSKKTYLEDPKAKEREELIALVVEAVVFARFEDAEEQEAGEARAPEHDEEGGEDVAGVVVPS